MEVTKTSSSHNSNNTMSQRLTPLPSQTPSQVPSLEVLVLDASPKLIRKKMIPSLSHKDEVEDEQFMKPCDFLSSPSSKQEEMPTANSPSDGDLKLRSNIFTIQQRVYEEIDEHDRDILLSFLLMS